MEVDELFILIMFIVRNQVKRDTSGSLAIFC